MAYSPRNSGIAVLGLKETLRALDQMDLRTRKETRKELYNAAVQVRDTAKTFVNPEGLSGWGKWRGGYSARNIDTGIRLTRLTNHAYGFTIRNMIAVVNSNPAGAIWEVAGRKSRGKLPKKGRRQRRTKVWTEGRNGRMGWHYQATGEPGRTYGNGRAFIAAITDKSGDASRTVWAAYDQTDAGFVKRRVEEMLIREGRTTQRKIDMNPY